jgi:Mg2+ and Co2+ transporter CorA
VRVREVTDAGVNELTAADVGTAVAAGGGLVWMDLDHTDQQGMALLPLLFDVRAADIEDCHVRTPVPKLHLYADHHYTSINGLARGTDKRLCFQPVKIFQRPHVVVTVLGPTSAALSADAAHHELATIHRRLDEGLRPGTSLELITAIRREMMGTMEALVGGTASRIADLEGKIPEVGPGEE